MNFDYDVLIIGAGVTGCAIARELSKSNLKTAVFEKEEDVCSGTSKANSGIVHAGYDAMPGTLKAKMNKQGTDMMPGLAKDLDFDYKNTGSLVLCFDESHRPVLEDLYKRGLTNGIEGLRIVEKDELHAMEPRLSDQAICALYAPTAGIVCPFGLTIALAENAADNGVEFHFNTPVETIEKTDDGWLVNGNIKARAIVNAAGVYADKIHNMVCDDSLEIIPKRGEYFLFDKDAASAASHVLFQLPTAAGKGVLITPTVHGNLMAGPTAEDQEDKDDVSTTAPGLAQVREKASKTIPDLPYNKVITSFAGLRAHEKDGDFVLQESADGFFDAAGIESPGLSSAPAIGKYIADLVFEKYHPDMKEDFIAERKGFVKLEDLSDEEWEALIEKDPDYGTIVCRCEMVSAGQIKDACTRSIPAVSLDGVKRRVRAGMGRCQAGFCTPKTMEIISECSGIPFEHIAKNKEGSRLLVEKDKEEWKHE